MGAITSFPYEDDLQDLVRIGRELEEREKRILENRNIKTANKKTKEISEMILITGDQASHRVQSLK